MWILYILDYYKYTLIIKINYTNFVNLNIKIAIYKGFNTI